MDASGHLVIGAFGPFGPKSTNQADEVAKRLVQMRERGELQVPEDVRVTVVPMETNVDSVQQFVQTAKQMQADRVLMLGESGSGLKVEAQAHDRGQPHGLLLSAVTSLLPSFGEHETLATAAPADQMAQASGAAVSKDAGNFYCNYSYHSALQAGLNAVFVHVPSGILGLGRDPDGAARGVNQMLGAWYQADANGPLVMRDCHLGRADDPTGSSDGFGAIHSTSPARDT
ncbi:MAG: hypothetical protein FJX76_10445 [Armatimonadetes bacterium]|nr:hypothetical protein [Armatimonadota bacterium]